MMPISSDGAALGALSKAEPVNTKVPQPHYTLIDISRGGPGRCCRQHRITHVYAPFYFPWHLSVLIDCKLLTLRGMPTAGESFGRIAGLRRTSPLSSRVWDCGTERKSRPSLWSYHGFDASRPCAGRFNKGTRVGTARTDRIGCRVSGAIASRGNAQLGDAAIADSDSSSDSGSIRVSAAGTTCFR